MTDTPRPPLEGEGLRETFYGVTAPAWADNHLLAECLRAEGDDGKEWWYDSERNRALLLHSADTIDSLSSELAATRRDEAEQAAAKEAAYALLTAAGVTGDQDALFSAGYDRGRKDASSELAATREERDQIAATIPDTYYAHLPLWKRIDKMAAAWGHAVRVADELAEERDRLAGELWEMAGDRANLLGALQHIAQFDPRWKGQHINTAPSRAQLIAVAYDALDASQKEEG